MWCIQDGAARPRSLTKTISRIVNPAQRVHGKDAGRDGLIHRQAFELLM